MRARTVALDPTYRDRERVTNLRTTPCLALRLGRAVRGAIQRAVQGREGVEQPFARAADLGHRLGLRAWSGPPLRHFATGRVVALSAARITLRVRAFPDSPPFVLEVMPREPRWGRSSGDLVPGLTRTATADRAEDTAPQLGPQGVILFDERLMWSGLPGC